MDIGAEFAATSGCPVLVVYYFIGCHRGFDDKILNKMRSLAHYYNYSDILNMTKVDKNAILTNSDNTK